MLPFLLGTALFLLSSILTSAFILPARPSSSFGPQGTRHSTTRTLSSRADDAIASPVLTTTVEDTFPSEIDISDDDAANNNREAAVTLDKTQVDELKRELFLIAARTSRGQLAKPYEKEMVNDICSSLAAMAADGNGKEGGDANIDGTWELLYGDVQLFRQSPFWMTLRRLFGSATALPQAESLFDLHRLQTRVSEIGRVRQKVADGKMVSEVDLAVGLLPGLPMAVKGTVVSSADVRPVKGGSANDMALQLLSTYVRDANVLPMLGRRIRIPWGALMRGALGGSLPSVKYSTLYVDDDLRISKTDDGHLFVYVRC
ncbi:unnamed protein product [Vitrella brassicaformis CCMP3155]|uniref:Plastid lipid-associated protein/fibrillin conserved domain-containing protein n=2 Tax=Vitrella brassicaformis TaxID=1169539 RepID=A0A0G4EBL4_VITBC|nr:unnamed protein product [Vitrella brassicaformis CCMP3155]|eukprot:CEL92680.1 unnamed protein product [Vitrella brassicaformis CCMP3155]